LITLRNLIEDKRFFEERERRLEEMKKRAVEIIARFV